MSKKESPATKGAREMNAKRWKNAPEEQRERLRNLRSKPTKCHKCGELCPTARQARVHCSGKK